MRAGQLEAARTEEFEVVDLVTGLMIGGLPVGYKAALGLMGICQPHVAAPGHPLSTDQERTLREFLSQRGLLTAGRGTVAV